ncbi:hypothetical protein [Variovorax boronicumulans]|uniref:hypothetical protein n=1 Tax=Variovorax boronicumulans TaxID=436515 RepID=UPI003390F3BC
MIADDYRRTSQVLGLGFLPLVLIWGIVWAVAGWRAQRPARPATPEEAVLEARKNLSLRIRTTIAVVAVVGIGLFAATWQFHAADNEAVGNAIAGWFGEWVVYGLFAYVVLRFIPRTPPGFAIVLASLVVVGGVNYKTYAAISEDRQAFASLAKAAPLINKIQSGTAVSDQEVKDAHVGLMEPLMLAQAAYSRDVIAIAATYTKAVSGLQLELMLTPTSLASPSIRAQTRTKLKIWQTATADYQIGLQAATARGKLGIQAAQSQMPAAMAGSASKGFDESSAQLSAYLVGLVNSEKEARGTITAMLDLMDANPGGYVVDKGPPVNLLFRDETVLVSCPVNSPA